VEEKIGFIGVGAIGAPMAQRLIEKGYPLLIFDISEEAVRPLIKVGAQLAKSAAHVASQAEIVLVSLPTPDVVRNVALGSNGLATGSAIKIYVDLSTTGPKIAQEVSIALREKGIEALDAPVSGGIAGAKKGTLTIMLSGSKAAAERIRPILANIGKNVIYIGDKPGLGQMMKLVNNLLSGTALAAASEAFVLGVKSGLDPNVMLKVINSSSGRMGAIEDKFPKAILSRTFDWGFKTDLIYKDIKLCLDRAEEIGVPMWIGNAVRQLWAYAVSQGGGPQDFTTIIKYIESWAGVEVGKQD
jgi:3-hydroxyisobutyrate dehydrogenase-like beta-hydroxyacid dehydrogenase